MTATRPDCCPSRSSALEQESALVRPRRGPCIFGLPRRPSKVRRTRRSSVILRKSLLSRQSRIAIVSGDTGRTKRLRVDRRPNLSVNGPCGAWAANRSGAAQSERPRCEVQSFDERSRCCRRCRSDLMRIEARRRLALHIGTDLPDIAARREPAVGDPVVDHVTVGVLDDPLVRDLKAVLPVLGLLDGACGAAPNRRSRHQAGHHRGSACLPTDR